MSVRKKIYVHMIYHFAMSFSVWLWGSIPSHHAGLTKAKRFLQKEDIRSPNDAWKDYLKTWNWWNSQSF